MMKVGLIGFGYWGKIIKPKLEKYFDLVFVADSKTEYDLTGLDWVFIATPTITHYDIVSECLEMGINVFCEKPLTLDPNKSRILFDLAKVNDVKLYVDNIFLGRYDYIRFRDSILNLNTYPITKINFDWVKYGPFNDTLVNDLLYHDIYLSLDMLGLDSDIEILNKDIKDDTLSLKANYKDVELSFNYDRKQPTKSKVITINDNVILQMNNNSNDPLSEILNKISNNDNIDYKLNKKITLKTEEIIYGTFKKT